MVQQDFWENMAGQTGVVIAPANDLFVNVRFGDKILPIEFHNLKKVGDSSGVLA